MAPLLHTGTAENRRIVGNQAARQLQEPTDAGISDLVVDELSLAPACHIATAAEASQVVRNPAMGLTDETLNTLNDLCRFPTSSEPESPRQDDQFSGLVHAHGSILTL